MLVRFAVAGVVVTLLVLGGPLLLGCDREDEIRAYQAPKDQAHTPAPTGRMTPPQQAVGGDAPVFTIPTGWAPIGQQQALRFAAFQVSQTDPTAIVTVIPLGREGGELLANINRWEGQVGLPPSKAEELDQVTRQIKVEGVPVTMVDLTGPQLRTLAAMVPRGERVWFFKLTGNVQTVASVEGEFEEFVNSIRFEDSGGAASGAGAGAGEGSMLQRRAGSPPDEAGSPLSPQWVVPQGWVQDADRPMRFATFRTADEANAAEVIVSSFGAFGTMEDNINRWRGMVGLEPIKDVNEQPVERIKIDGRDGALFDMTGPARDGQPALRLILAMVPVEQTVWFFRMTGPADGVEPQKANFDAFLESVRFGP